MMATSLLCLALVVAREAGGEPVPVQVAVAHVVRNRTVRAGRPVCNVTNIRAQFSSSRKKPDLDLIRRVRDAWRKADVTHGATHFHDPRLVPYWARKMTRTVRIGRLSFYKNKGGKS